LSVFAEACAEVVAAVLAGFESMKFDCKVVVEDSLELNDCWLEGLVVAASYLLAILVEVVAHYQDPVVVVILEEDSELELAQTVVLVERSADNCYCPWPQGVHRDYPAVVVAQAVDILLHSYMWDQRTSYLRKVNVSFPFECLRVVVLDVLDPESKIRTNLVEVAAFLVPVCDCSFVAVAVAAAVYLRG